MTRFHSTLAAGAAFIFTAFAASAVLADTTLLNVSYDPTRELYKAVNEAFIKDWKAKDRRDRHHRAIAWRLRQAGPRRHRRPPGRRRDAGA